MKKWVTLPTTQGQNTTTPHPQRRDDYFTPLDRSSIESSTCLLGEVDAATPTAQQGHHVALSDRDKEEVHNHIQGIIKSFMTPEACRVQCGQLESLCAQRSDVREYLLAQQMFPNVLGDAIKSDLTNTTYVCRLTLEIFNQNNTPTTITPTPQPLRRGTLGVFWVHFAGLLVETLGKALWRTLGGMVSVVCSTIEVLSRGSFEVAQLCSTGRAMESLMETAAGYPNGRVPAFAMMSRVMRGFEIDCGSWSPERFASLINAIKKAGKAEETAEGMAVLNDVFRQGENVRRMCGIVPDVFEVLLAVTSKYKNDITVCERAWHAAACVLTEVPTVSPEHVKSAAKLLTKNYRKHANALLVVCDTKAAGWLKAAAALGKASPAVDLAKMAAITVSGFAGMKNENAKCAAIEFFFCIADRPDYVKLIMKENPGTVDLALHAGLIEGAEAAAGDDRGVGGMGSSVHAEVVRCVVGFVAKVCRVNVEVCVGCAKSSQVSSLLCVAFEECVQNNEEIRQWAQSLVESMRGAGVGWSPDARLAATMQGRPVEAAGAGAAAANGRRQETGGMDKQETNVKS